MDAFIKLLRIAVKQQYEPIDLTPPSCWNNVYTLAQKHNVNNLICEAVNYLPPEQKPPKQILDALTANSNKQIMVDIHQQCVADELTKAFEANNIPAILLKGLIMKQLYPRPDLRSMSDMDILMHPEDQKRVHKLLLDMEYECKSYGEKRENVYFKSPFVTIEMHKMLFMYQDDWNEFFSNIWNRSFPITEGNCVLQPDKELFLTYIIAHTAKHFKDGGGNGIRVLLDFYIYLEHYKNELDFDKIKTDLKSLNLLKYGEKMLALSEMLFGNRKFDSSYIEFTKLILSGTIYGTYENFVMNNPVMRDDPTTGKWSYIWKRAFPNLEAMQLRVPQLKKYPVLLPYYWIKRLSYSLINRRNFLKNEIRTAATVDQNKMQQLKTLYHDWGLD